MPGVVVDYDLATQTATVQPSLRRKLGGQVMNLPKLTHVPVVFPATATTWLRLPVGPGDPVQLHFSEASLDKWWVVGGEVDPAIPARFALGDAFAMPGLHAKPMAIVPKGAPSSVELVNGAGWLEITADGRFKLANGSGELLTLLDQVIEHLAALYTIPAVVGSPLTLDPNVIRQLQQDKLALDQLKG